VLRNIPTDFARGSIKDRGISTLQERYQVLEFYIGLENFISGSRPISQEGKLVPKSLHRMYRVA
jgi:hypothetical protein